MVTTIIISGNKYVTALASIYLSSLAKFVMNYYYANLFIG